MRKDEVKSWHEAEVEAALKDASEREGKFIKVKRILE
ncbi:hypothetical protein COT96_02935 [Candidatus Falkowbacteria bacterium CG10_big_fil_rev_8_21_14_0_10_38_22]|uniref:Uncharacterized protein n=1 Tax=Candidatus Falkowbacteria bacterium CG10_big_fil_rev_8_21_14_0_10_38_22 TaxID=1974564 RepID=A0A2M6WPG3_9BACT|nr:MAG: hypothetical protein COT96_02935 [Candidatus Falkowbacteria bacterium CG10_big_fil_rev_8_21_14_0_10_38_22]